MKIFFDKFCLPSQKNIVIQKDQITLTESFIPGCDLYFSNESSNSLNSYLSIFEEDSFEIISENYFKMAKELKIKNPKWNLLLKKDEYTRFRSLFKSRLTNLVGKINSIEYSDYYASGNYVVNNLSNIHIDIKSLEERIRSESNPTLKSIVSSFLPKENNICKNITYNRMKTTTGRLVVSDGPQILLLPKDTRSSIVSRYGKEGSVLWVDFVSLEPRFTKLLSSKETSVDIYSDIIKDSSIDCSREKVKLAVLSTLFGAGMKKLTEILGKDAFEVRKAIKEYFKLDKVSEKIGNYKSGKIKNFFGRNIFLKSPNFNLSLNNYIQSSCVDISLIGFSSLLQDPDFPKSAKPVAVVHDALVLDVKNNDLQKLEEIINKGIDIDNLGKFYLGFESYE
tara:strand:- start:324 stop:1505 length:1182 start_codon:yes stop_codon:yes gene_type:complete